MVKRSWRGFIFFVSLLITLVPNMAAMESVSAAYAESANELSDLEGHWAQQTFETWLNREWIQGYPDGTYQPDKEIKRSEFVALVNRAFGFSSRADELPFSDVGENYWAYNDLSVAYEAGYFNGAGGKANAEQAATRQESAVMIANALQASETEEASLAKYHDRDSIASWATSAMASLSEKHIFKGDPEGNIRPLDMLTRAEAITVIEAALPYLNKKTTFDQAGVYGSADAKQKIEGDVVITAPGVTLVNMEITGDLLLAESIGEGDATLKSVNVKGTVTVQGGGENSVYIEDSILVRVIVDKADGKVRIVLSGPTSVDTVIVHTPVKLDATETQAGNGIQEVELSDRLPKGATVDLIGQFEDVRVLSTSIRINIPTGSIANVEVGENSENNEINLGDQASIIKLVLNAVASLTGQGEIGTATVNEKAKGTQFEKQPNSIEGSEQSSMPIIPPVSSGGGTVQPPAPDQTNAYLSKIELSNSFQLEQRDAALTKIGTGFDKDVFEYTIPLERDMTAVTIPIKATPESSAATASVKVYSKGALAGSYDLTTSNNEFDVHLTPMEDVQIYIYVQSGNGLISKRYSLSFQYERTIKESFELYRDLSPDFENRVITYRLFSRNIFEEGDVVEVYEDSSNATPFNIVTIGTSGLYDLELKTTSYEMQEQGSFYVRVTRGGLVVASGNYEYNLSEMPRVESSDGISMELLTTEELLAGVDRGDYTADTPYVLHIAFDPNEWSGGLFEHAKYYKINNTSSGYLYPEILAPLQSENRLDYNPYDFSGRDVNTDYIVEGFNIYQDKMVFDRFIQVLLYDENGQPLGYYEQVIEPDAEHVMPGYSILHTVHPELNVGDTEAPVITGIVPDYVSIGDDLQVAVSEQANVYMVPADTPLDGRTIHQTVRNGMGAGSTYYPANDSTTLGTMNLSAGNWMLVAVDGSGNLSEPIGIEVLNREDIALHSLTVVQDFNSGLLIMFDSEIQNNKETLELLKQEIMFSNDGGVTYAPLGIEDTISLDGSWLEIQFVLPYSGSQNRIKVKADSLANSNNQVMDRDWISPVFADGTLVTLISDSNIEAGDEVIFKVDRPAKLYLLPEKVVGDPMNLDELVATGLAKSMVVDEEGTNQEQILSTEGLDAGRYLLITMHGTVHQIGISISSSLEMNQVHIVNSDDMQSITISELNPGDIVRVYLNAMDVYDNPAREVTVSEGESSVTITDLELNEEGGALFFTVQTSEHAESGRIYFPYSPVNEL
ncbi:S-layer homology domain-containing protein [Paenibacillus sp. HB172176]|uniref:S-layer homology domain-containing protein n=1 Tax=Paenibacillus sp. HB172176 TaxID=2493690 RepID=UPI0014386DC8|nr:S-layer homology domain-containing protein [Paenibacillus sp. HB172176]